MPRLRISFIWVSTEHAGTAFFDYMIGEHGIGVGCMSNGETLAVSVCM